jgi:hypothetical protein
MVSLAEMKLQCNSMISIVHKSHGLGNIVAETIDASREAKMFPSKFRNICNETMFARNNVS